MENPRFLSDISPEALYIHIPFCVSKCAYCDFFSVACGKELPDSYVSALENEIKVRLEDFSVKKVRTVYIGGGTPSLLSENQLEKITSAFLPLCTEASEITMEVNADDVSEMLLSSMEKCGINRLSVGVQTFDEKSLSFVKRRGTPEKSLSALNLIKKMWKGKVSVDLISSLPFQTEERLLGDLEKIISFGFEHISLYSLTFEEGTPLSKMLSKGDFSYDFDKADQLWLKGSSFLQKNGYSQYEVSNFYRNDDEKNKCLHNMNYWNLKSYAAFGSGACGTLYEKDYKSALRYTNTKNIEEYIRIWKDSLVCEEKKLSSPSADLSFKRSDLVCEGKKLSSDSANCFCRNGLMCEGRIIPPSHIETPDFYSKFYSDFEILSKETLIFEYFMMGLRKREGINLSDFEKAFSIPLPDNYRKAVDKWCRNGLAVLSEDNIFSFTEEGFVLLNQFLMEL